MRINRILIAGTLIMLLLGQATGESHAADPSILTGANFLSNGGFESGTLLPDNWVPEMWRSEIDFSWDASVTHSGRHSARIRATIANDGRWLQAVTVQPYTQYRLSGWIRTQDVAHSGKYSDAGANLSVYGTWSHSSPLFGTNEWTFVSFTFDSGDTTRLVIAARLGYWSGETTGTAWFDDIRLERETPFTHHITLPLVSAGPAHPCTSSHPSWRILFLVYGEADIQFTDRSGQVRHYVAALTQSDRDRIAYAATRFVQDDMPALNSCNMLPTVTIRYAPQPLKQVVPLSCNDYAPDPGVTAADRDPAFDSVIAIWDGSGQDLLTGEALSLQGCAYAWPMGRGQTYDAIPADYVNYRDRNIFKHEWGHSLTFYYDAAGTAPKPAVNNHINDTDIRYVNCQTGSPYILQDDTDLDPIPNSIYHNTAGFTHDYYSGLTATADMPARCLGITPAAWASGGPVSRPRGANGAAFWRSPADDVIGAPVPFR